MRREATSTAVSERCRVEPLRRLEKSGINSYFQEWEREMIISRQNAYQSQRAEKFRDHEGV